GDGREEIGRGAELSGRVLKAAGGRLLPCRVRGQQVRQLLGPGPMEAVHHRVEGQGHTSDGSNLLRDDGQRLLVDGLPPVWAHHRPTAFPVGSLPGSWFALDPGPSSAQPLPGGPAQGSRAGNPGRRSWPLNGAGMVPNPSFGRKGSDRKST